MTVPKSKILSVSRGVLGLADVKNGCPKNTQSVVVNVSAKVENPPGVRNAVVNGEEMPDIKIVEPTTVHYDPPNINPYANIAASQETAQEDSGARDGVSSGAKTRSITPEESIDQLQALLKTKDSICQALSIILNLVENNPLIVNRYIIATKDMLCHLIRLLSEADAVDIQTSIGELGCCGSSYKYSVIDKIFVTKQGQTQILKYAYADVIKVLDEHRISTKFVIDEKIVYGN